DEAWHAPGRRRAVLRASRGPHPSGDRAQGALRQPSDDGADRRAAGGRERRAARHAVRAPGAPRVRLRACLAPRRPPDVGQPLHLACAHRFQPRRAAADAARHHPRRKAGVTMAAAPIYLTEADVGRLVTVKDAIGVLEELFATWGQSATANLPRQRARLPGGPFNLMGAAYGAKGGA